MILWPSQIVKRQVSYFNRQIGFILICQFILSTPAYSAEQEATQQELDAVNAAISEIGEWLEFATSRHSAAQQLVRDSELAASSLNQSITDLESSISAKEQNLLGLQLQQSELTSARDASQEVIEKVLAAAYVQGESGFLKTLLNQEDSSEANRMLYYTRRFGEFQLEEIEKYQSTINELDILTTTISSELNELASQREQLNSEKSRLESLLLEREAALLALNNEISSRNSELEQLEVNQAELQSLLEEIARAMTGIRSFADVPPMDSSRGELPLPLTGPVLSRFGSTYGGGQFNAPGYPHWCRRRHAGQCCAPRLCGFCELAARTGAIGGSRSRRRICHLIRRQSSIGSGGR